MDFAYGEIVTVKTVTTTTNDHGDSTETVATSTWGPCAVAPRFSTLSTDPRSSPVVIGLTVYGPTRAFDSDDRLVINGTEYAADGEPAVWANPFTGWEPGMELPVKRTAAV